MRIIKNVRWELYQANLNPRRIFPGQDAGALDAWDRWIEQQLRDTVTNANQFTQMWARRAADQFHGDQSPTGRAIYAMGNLYLARSTVMFDTSRLPHELPLPSPDTY